MKVQVNGAMRELPDATTVADLVAELGLASRHVVVERNGEPVARTAHADTRLRDGDVVEVVRPVQGGAPALDTAALYLVCDGRFPLDALEASIDAGVGMVQLREKRAEAAEVIATGTRMLAVCRRRGVPFVVNDRPDVALALGADGVHLGQDDLPPRLARDILGPGAIVGRSTHSPDQIDAAMRERAEGLADYIAVGPVHETPTKPGRPGVGLELVRYAAANADGPWFAIGGIDASNVGDVVAAGARRVVVVRAICDADDPSGAAKLLRDALP